MLLAFPGYAPLGQSVVIAAYPEPDAAILAVGQARVGQGIEVEIDHIVQRSDGRLNGVAHSLLVLEREVTEGEAGEIAHHKVAGLRSAHDDRLAVHHACLRRSVPDGAHVLGYLRAEVGAVDHALVRVGVEAVHCVAVEGEGCARLDG